LRSFFVRLDETGRLRSRLPAMYEMRQFVDSGGLMSYGASSFDVNRRAAAFVYKKLRKGEPGEGGLVCRGVGKDRDRTASAATRRWQARESQGQE